MNTPYAGSEGMLSQMKGKLAILNEKTSRLSYSLVMIVMKTIVFSVSTCFLYFSWVMKIF